jgi:hypothetical protein
MFKYVDCVGFIEQQNERRCMQDNIGLHLLHPVGNDEGLTLAPCHQIRAGAEFREVLERLFWPSRPCRCPLLRGFCDRVICDGVITLGGLGAN